MSKPISVLVLSTDLDEFHALRAALAADPRVQLLGGGTDAEQIREQAVSLNPTAVIVMLGNDPEPAMNLIQRLAQDCPSAAVISAGTEASSGILLKTLRSGAREFLRLPINVDEMKTVFDRITESIVEPVEPIKKKARLISVFSSKGGCGTSFIATNLAACMTGRTLLIDLNLQAGDLPLFLGVTPRHTLAGIIDAHARLDDQLISALAHVCNPNLHLLAAPREADFFEKIKAEHVIKVLDRLRENYDCIVLDPQHTFDPITVAALDQSDEIVLVLTLDIPAIQSAKRSLDLFDRLGYPRKKVRIVVNRWNKQDDLDISKVENVLREPVLGTMQSDYHRAVSSINLGTPLIKSDSTSKLAREIRQIAHKLFPEVNRTPEPKAMIWWKRWFVPRAPAQKA
jgi:pilus assembly protein CpaE